MKSLRQIHDRIVGKNTAELLADVCEKKKFVNDKSTAIYFLNNLTINAIEPFLKTYLYESNFNSTIVFGGYDNIQQDILDDASPLYQQKFDIVVCSLLYFPTDPCFLAQLSNNAELINSLKSTWDRLQEKTNALLLINTVLSPFLSYENIAPLTNSITYAEAISELNQFIRAYAREHNNRVFLMDWTRYVQIIGEQNSIDYRYKYLYQSPFKKSFLNHYACDIASIVRIANGQSKKCLILDCDNTLWGGIVGEDGVTGIKLSNHDYPGKIFYDFQYTLLALAERGVILTLCSKNNEADVWEILEKHPHCLLRRHHFSAARINWQNKADNIIEMISELNIGLDSCVFLDDSPTECEWVKKALPDITVLQVPQQLYDYPGLLLKERLFDTLVVSKEDASRHVLYQQEAQRKAELTHAKDMDSYLQSLSLTADIHFVRADEIPRVAQLTQKTNQFNASTKRYTQADIEQFFHADDAAVMCLAVTDKFGHYGLTGVLIAKRNNNKGIIDTMLMSCRILSRHLEYAFLNHVLKKLGQQWGVTQWEMDYIPTTKNTQIAPFLNKMGFVSLSENRYSLDTVVANTIKTDHINIVAEGLTYV